MHQYFEGKFNRRRDIARKQIHREWVFVDACWERLTFFESLRSTRAYFSKYSFNSLQTRLMAALHANAVVHDLNSHLIR